MPNDEVIQTTEREIVMREKQAVLSSKVKVVEDVIPEIFSRIKSVDEGINDIPMQIIKCRDDMDAATKKWAHEIFITDKELTRFESKLEGKVATELSKVTMKINKAVWVITGFITAATFFNYIISHTQVLH